MKTAKAGKVNRTATRRIEQSFELSEPLPNSNRRFKRSQENY
jgi:hypothetical protein